MGGEQHSSCWVLGQEKRETRLKKNYSKGGREMRRGKGIRVLGSLQVIEVLGDPK